MTKKSARDPEIELLRVLLMLGICIVHIINIGRAPGWVDSLTWLHGLVVCSVVGFVFISGYYGIRFSFAKLLRLYGVAFYCAFVSALIYTVCGHSVSDAWHAAYNQICNGWWFLHAYAVMMTMTPLVNVVFEIAERRRTLMACSSVLFLVFAWSWIAVALDRQGLLFPMGRVFDSHSWLTLFGVYIAARLYRQWEVGEWFGWPLSVSVLLGVPFLIGFRSCVFGSYNAPHVLILTICIFSLFKRIRLGNTAGETMGRVLAFMTPSLFSVYLLHNGFCGKLLIAHYVEGGFAGTWYGMFVVIGVAIIIFSVSFVADAPRRILAFLLRKVPCRRHAS